MGLITVYKCDRCGKEWRFDSKKEDQDQLIGIRLNINFNGNFSFNQYDTKQALWCRSCVMQTGIEKPTMLKDKEVAPETPLTFEEKVVLLIEELGFRREE